jgi:hypothetical protein
MADANELARINLYKIGNKWQSVPVMALDDDSFMIVGGRGEQKVFRDEDLKPDETGKYIINIEYLDLKFFYPNVDLPKEFEFPLFGLAARKEKRRVNALECNSISVRPDYKNPEAGKVYFYIERDKLRIYNRENAKEVTVDKIETIYGKKAVNVESLELGHHYLQLPPEVAGPFERILKEKELKKLALVLKGKSVLDGKKYYGFNMEIPAEKWGRVKDYFEDFGPVTDDAELNGFLTCQPGKVAEILGIPLQSGL